MLRTPFVFLMILPSPLFAQSSVDEMRGASDKAQSVHDNAQPSQVVALGSDSIHDLASVEVPPQFPGGEQAMHEYLRRNIKYPMEAREAGIQGKVYVEFVIARDGSVESVRSLRSQESPLSKEGVRVVQGMPRWSPGRMLGKPVNVKYVLPINFKLDEDHPPVEQK